MSATVVPNLVVDMRYLGSDNFVGKPIDGYEKPVCYLTREAAAALAEVARDLEPQGLAIKAFDCYRPVRAVAHFVRWARDLRDQARKADYYPQVDKHDLFRDGYIAARSGHSRGSTLDMTLVRRADGQELDMGTPFDFFSPRSAPSDKSRECARRRPIARCSPTRCAAAASCRTTRNGGTSRCGASRSPTPISIFRSGEAFAETENPGQGRGFPGDLSIAF